MRRAGFSDGRVRHHGSIELPLAEVREAGLAHVTVDLAGIQSGAFTMQVLQVGGRPMGGASTGSAVGGASSAGDGAGSAVGGASTGPVVGGAGSAVGGADPLDGIANLDLARARRRGYPEAVYCEGKSAEQVRAVARRFGQAGGPESGAVLFTRAGAHHAEAIMAELPDASHDELAGLLAWPGTPPSRPGSSWWWPAPESPTFPSHGRRR